MPQLLMTHQKKIGSGWRVSGRREFDAVSGTEVGDR
jgi:hypothetical protein